MDDPTSPAPPSLRDHFLADHQALESLLLRVLDTFQGSECDQARALWQEFAGGLTRHMHAEESIVVPLLLHTHRGEARAILEEHRHLRSRLAEIGAQLAVPGASLATARIFVDELRAHTLHEDAVLYRWADETMLPSDRASLIGALVGTTPRGPWSP